MKGHRRRMRTLALALTAALVLAACQKPAPGGEEGPETAPAASAPAVSTPVETAPAAVCDDSLIGEALAQDGGEGEYAYSYHVPRLMGDSDVIAAINDELDSTFGAQARLELEDMGAGSLPFYHSIRWESHWTGSLLSLVVQAESIDFQTSSAVIHYDFAQDKRLDSVQVLKRLGVSEEAFLWSARRAVMQDFDAHYRDDAELHRDMSLYYQSWYGEDSILSNRASTLAAVTAEDALVYPEDGGCYYIASLLLGGAGGSGWYSRTLALDLDPASEDKTVEDGAVTAVLENGRVFLSVANWEAVLDNTDADPDGFYEVEGLYSNYTDLFLGDLSGDYRPVLFLLTDQGTLEYLDIGRGAWYGIFCAMPIPGDFTGVTLENVKTGGVEGDYYTTCACWPDGSMEDLGLWVYCAERAVPQGSWYAVLEEIPAEGGSYARIGNVDFRDQEMDFSVTELDAAVDSGFAQLQALGMTEAGIVCGCTQFSYNGPDYGGAFAYRSGLTVEEDRYCETLLVDLLTGTSPLGETGDRINFYRSYGEE